MIRIGIMGYGNLAKGVERAISQNQDMELAAVFTRRDPRSLALSTPGVPVLRAEDAERWEGMLDVMILCGGSAQDLPAMTPAMARRFHVIDSFDTHALIPTHFAAVQEAAAESGHLALISAGWDPGLFSLARLYFDAVLPRGQTYTFWGEGVSQGHSDAIRRIPGVADGRQYTVPVPEAVERIRRGEEPELSPREMHTRRCFVAAEDGADRDAVIRAIRTMPHYFADYDTTVEFVTQEELVRHHSGLPHGGRVIRSAEGQTMEFSLQLASNPQFTGAVLAACARAVHRMAARGAVGTITMADIPPADLSPLSREELLSRIW